MNSGVLRIGPRITVLPVVHGSGDFAWEVRRTMLESSFDCLAVPLPESFRIDVERGIERLPTPTAVLQRDYYSYEFLAGTGEFPADDEEFPTDDGDGTSRSGASGFTGDEAKFSLNHSYVPIDPCQPVIAAIRAAMGERLPRAYVDLETASFEPHGQMMPDAFALKRVPIDRFAAAILPTIRRPVSEQRLNRIHTMASRLKSLCERFERILFVCNIVDWPWIKEAFDRSDVAASEDEPVNETELHSVDSSTLYFFLRELPFVTQLYERARSELESDEYLSVDGVKELLLASRDRYQQDLRGRARKITPHRLAVCLKYLRNLMLIERRFTPDLAGIVAAAQQVFGDQYALHVFEAAKTFEYVDGVEDLDEIRMGIEKAELPDAEISGMTSRLPGVPTSWRSFKIKNRPDPEQQKIWQQRWNPFRQCSWPPEDELIENFRQTVFDRAQQVMGADLARTEKFTSSIKDGIDIRDTLRHWYEGEIYVKVLPPNRGGLDCAVMLFDSPADPRDYPWRTTWFAEHDEESTLSFFATDFRDNPVGPGICLANYGGAMFLYPPRPIEDIWNDRRLDFTETLEERLLAAACLHSQNKAIALLSSAPPGVGWRKLAKRFGKTWVHLPLSQFSSETVAQLKFVHVLNGKEVRSFAADFIRRA